MVVRAGAYALAAALLHRNAPLGLSVSRVIDVLWAIGADNGRLRSRLSARWTIVLTDVGFAWIHQVASMIPLAVTVGLTAGVIRELTGSATIPIIVHAALNLTIVGLSYMATGWNVPSLFQA